MTHDCHNSPDLSSCYHFIIGGWWLISPGTSVLVSASTEYCDDCMLCNAAWLTAGQPRSWVTAVCCCRQRLEAAAWLRPEVSLCESFPLLKICRNSKRLLQNKVSHSSSSNNSSSHWFKLSFCHQTQMNHHPALSLPTQAWIPIHTGVTQFDWTLGLMQLSALSGLWMTSGTIRRRVTSAIWIITAANSAEFWGNYLHRTEQNWKELTCCIVSAHQWSDISF